MSETAIQTIEGKINLSNGKSAKIYAADLELIRELLGDWCNEMFQKANESADPLYYDAHQNARRLRDRINHLLDRT